MRLTLRQLQLFECVARVGSFTRAAEVLHLSQPAVSMQIKQLEDVLGIALLQQTGKRIRLTEAGEVVLQTAQDLHARLESLQMRLADLKGLKSGRLRLAVMTTAQYFIPQVLGLFCRAYPGIEICLEVTNREHALERLQHGQDDLYIFGRKPEGHELEVLPFAPNPLVVMASASHPLAGQSHIPLKTILQEPFLMREPGSGSRDAVLRLFASQGMSAQVRMELGSNEAIKNAIVAGLGISVLSVHTLTLESARGPIVILDVEGFPILRQWYVAYPRAQGLSLVAQTFFEFLMSDGQRLAMRLADELLKPHPPTPTPTDKPCSGA